jgi:hypothetical protein
MVTLSAKPFTCDEDAPGAALGVQAVTDWGAGHTLAGLTALKDNAHLSPGDDHSTAPTIADGCVLDEYSQECLGCILHGNYLSTQQPAAKSAAALTVASVADIAVK